MLYTYTIIKIVWEDLIVPRPPLFACYGPANEYECVFRFAYEDFGAQLWLAVVFFIIHSYSVHHPIGVVFSVKHINNVNEII